MSAIVHKPFFLTGYHTALMKADDQAELQTLLERCADYSLLVDGSPPIPSAAASLLSDCPPGKTLANKFVIGFSTRKQDLIGVLDAVRDYPTQDDWWLGLLLLDPVYRNQRLGRRIYQAFEHWASLQGARRIFLGVIEENDKAYQFWQKLGFEILERQPERQFGNMTHVVITMVRNLSEA
jgi:ribosomal protein S18 acetylase RimI-like enzyme